MSRHETSAGPAQDLLSGSLYARPKQFAEDFAGSVGRICRKLFNSVLFSNLSRGNSCGRIFAGAQDVWIGPSLLVGSLGKICAHYLWTGRISWQEDP